MRNDIIFIAALLAAVVLFGLIFYFARGDGDTVTVAVDGELVGEYSLSAEITVEIKSDNGENTLVIEGGEAYVSHASCPDGICSSHKPISRNGESIVCLPNKVVITVEKSNSDAPDVIVGG